MQEELEVVDRNDNIDILQCIGGTAQESKMSALNRITNSCCAGASRRRAAEERLCEVQEEPAIVAQEEPEVVHKVN